MATNLTQKSGNSDTSVVVKTSETINGSEATASSGGGDVSTNNNNNSNKNGIQQQQQQQQPSAAPSTSATSNSTVTAPKILVNGLVVDDLDEKHEKAIGGVLAARKKMADHEAKFMILDKRAADSDKKIVNLETRLKSVEQKAAYLERRLKSQIANDEANRNISELEAQFEQAATNITSLYKQVKRARMAIVSLRQANTVSTTSSVFPPTTVLTNDNKQKELFEACYLGDVERARHLLLNEQTDANGIYYLEKHGKIFGFGDPGDTCLLFASWQGQTEVVRMLIEEFKVDVNHQKANGWTALHLAAEGGLVNVARLLCEVGNANLEVKDDYRGRTPLMIAAFLGKYEFAEYLLSRGANVNETDMNGNTALAVAGTVLGGSTETKAKTIEVLKRHGAAT